MILLFLIFRQLFFHDTILLFLGLRGQAKTKIARLMINLLDEYIPVVEGSELNDDPLNPLSVMQKKLLQKMEIKQKFPGFTDLKDIPKNLLLRMYQLQI